MNFFIYGIIDPRNQEIFYVGETKDFERRCREHLEGTDQLSGVIVRQIKENSFVPLFVVLERCEDEEAALTAEIFWIETLKSRGCKLTNAQAFSGYAERRAERGKQTGKLQNMKALRFLANGRKLNGTASSGGWSSRDLARLRGMERNKIEPKVMAEILGKPLKEIKTKLAEL